MKSLIDFLVPVILMVYQHLDVTHVRVSCVRRLHTVYGQGQSLVIDAVTLVAPFVRSHP